MLRLIKHQLNSVYSVCSVRDPADCIDEIIRTGSRLVLLDIDLGEKKSGLDLLREIKQFDGGVQVIMLTGLVSMETILTSMRDGAEACLFKPLNNKQELLDALAAAQKKIAIWHQSLRELMERKREASELTVAR